MKKMILISGAGSGIGQAIAKVLADLGHPIILLGRNQQSLEETRALPGFLLLCAETHGAESGASSALA